MRGLFSIKRLVFAGTLAALLLPISFSSGTGEIRSNNACADPGCCSKYGSMCYGGLHGTPCGDNEFQRSQ